MADIVPFPRPPHTGTAAGTGRLPTTVDALADLLADHHVPDLGPRLVAQVGYRAAAELLAAVDTELARRYPFPTYGTGHPHWTQGGA